MKILLHKHIWIVFIGFIVLGLLSALGASLYSVEHLSCNTLILNVKGDLASSQATGGNSGESAYVTYSDVISAYLDDIEDSRAIKAIIVDIDSYGGLPVAGEEIADALKRSSKTTVALIRSAGLSSAYWAASGADHIIASKNSDVGSIGVSLQLQNLVEKNRQEGVRVTSITSGPYKAIGDPNKELTKEEQKMLQEDVDKIHKNFVAAISENRNLELTKVSALATGASMLGEKALEEKLIDGIGGMNEVKDYLKKTLGTDVRICVPPPVAPPAQ